MNGTPRRRLNTIHDAGYANSKCVRHIQIFVRLFKASQQCNTSNVDYDLGANTEDQLPPTSRVLFKRWAIHMKSASLPMINKETTIQ